MEHIEGVSRDASGRASASLKNAASWRSKTGAAAKRIAKILVQLVLLLGVYAAGCALASVLPITLPGNIVGMVLLLALLGTGLLKTRHVGDACTCLIDNMSLSVDYYRIKLEDRASQLTAGYIRSDEDLSHDILLV